MNSEVTQLLDALGHPLRTRIDQVRQIILTTNVEENIKWNGPNYHVEGRDRLTLRIQPRHAFQLILHTGAKKVGGDNTRPAINDHGLLEWKANDRAVLELGKADHFDKALPHLSHIIDQWLSVTAVYNQCR